MTLQKKKVQSQKRVSLVPQSIQTPKIFSLLQFSDQTLKNHKKNS